MKSTPSITSRVAIPAQLAREFDRVIRAAHIATDNFDNDPSEEHTDAYDAACAALDETMAAVRAAVETAARAVRASEPFGATGYAALKRDLAIAAYTESLMIRAYVAARHSEPIYDHYIAVAKRLDSIQAKVRNYDLKKTLRK